MQRLGLQGVTSEVARSVSRVAGAVRCQVGEEGLTMEPNTAPSPTPPPANKEYIRLSEGFLGPYSQ